MSRDKPKIIYLTAGAAGMYCGSCMHDNTLAKALAQQGWDIQLVPTYTPIRTDEEDFSVDRVMFGGLNVFLQQKIPLFRYVPSALVRVLDNPRLIRRVTAKAMETDPKTLGSLTLSMLKGTRGNQRKEVRRLCDWLKQEQPDLLIFTNILIGGCIETIKHELDIPVLVTLQGDDVFLDGLEEPYRSKCMEQIARISQSVDGFIVHTEFFRDYMSGYFGFDAPKIHVTPLGIDVHDFQQMKSLASSTDAADTNQSRTIGYLARLAPEKGLHHLVDAFIQLKSAPEFSDVNLNIAGWLGPQNNSYAQSQWQKLSDAGLGEQYEYVGSIERAQKLELLSQLDVFCVPTEYQEPKGLYALEAMAAGVPIVQPDHGAFPELIQASRGGILFDHNRPTSLTEALASLLKDVEKRGTLGSSGQKFVRQSRNSEIMAKEMGEVIRHHLKQKPSDF